MMATSFRQWESDPLFSAAEVVQDSADRMESIFRMLLHEQGLVQGDPLDPKLLGSIDYHRRDLVTALGTTKWQLEDFEKAVNLSASSDNSRMREYAISRHRQFIRAIREQIILTEKSLEDQSIGDPERNTRWVNLNEQDRDGLALFLSGGIPVDNRANYDSESSSIMRRFLDSTTASGFDDNTDEIVELKIEDIESSNMNGIMHVDHSFDSSKEKLRKVGSHYSTRFDFEVPVSCQQPVGDRNGEDGRWDLEACDSSAKSFFSKNKLRGFHNRVNVFAFLGNLWSTYGSRMTRSSTKRRKDGEVGLEFEQRPFSSYIDIFQAEQGRHTRLGLSSGYSSSQRLFTGVFSNTVQLCNWLGAFMGRFQRSPYLIQVNRQSVRITTAIVVTLVILGILTFQVA